MNRSIIPGENGYRARGQNKALLLRRHAVVYKELYLGTCGTTQCAREKPH